MFFFFFLQAVGSLLRLPVVMKLRPHSFQPAVKHVTCASSVFVPLLLIPLKQARMGSLYCLGVRKADPEVTLISRSRAATRIPSVRDDNAITAHPHHKI